MEGHAVAVSSVGYGHTWRIDAAREYDRMVQIGSQGRSAAHKIKATQLLREGIIGKVYLSKGLCFKRRKSIGHEADGPVPPGIDWDKFLGPAPMRAFNKLRFKYNWHWFWDTGNGDIGNQGIHEMDIARWGLGKPGLPKSVVSTGGKYVYNDDQETPNTQIATFDYGDAELMFEVRGIMTGNEGGLAADRQGGNVIGNLFYGSDGWMALSGGSFQVYKGEKSEKIMDEKASDRDQPHFQNFLDCVKSRKYQDLHADVAIGVMSASLVHIANASYRVGKRLAFDEKTLSFPGDKEATSLLTRKYRAPYIVPEKV
jgi:predicted dehydrogenase